MEERGSNLVGGTVCGAGRRGSSTNSPALNSFQLLGKKTNKGLKKLSKFIRQPEILLMLHDTTYA